MKRILTLALCLLLALPALALGEEAALEQPVLVADSVEISKWTATSSRI